MVVFYVPNDFDPFYNSAGNIFLLFKKTTKELNNYNRRLTKTLGKILALYCISTYSLFKILIISKLRELLSELAHSH